MAQYIDKSALVAEINQRVEDYKSHKIDDSYYDGLIFALEDLRDDFIDSLPEEPVSEDFEEALAQEWKGYNDRGAATVDALEDNTQELAFAKGFYRGSKWQKAKEESVTQDLGEYINELSKQFQEVSFAKLSRIAVRVAKWQKEQNQSTIELAEDHAMLAGMEKMKEEMMAKAVDAQVKIDAGGYPYIPQMELYDYDKDEPLAKEGDKYKVVLIKEE